MTAVQPQLGAASAGPRVDTAAASDEATIAADANRRRRRRRIMVNSVRVVVFVVIVGGWQLLSHLKIIDPFFFSSPTSIVNKLDFWVHHGTQYGSIWQQIWVTMQEALLGFVYGVVAGIVMGLLLGQVPFLADVVGPYIKVMNAVPRIVLGSIFVIWLGLGTTSKTVLAGVLVFFVVFFNAFQGTREVDRNLVANVRVLGGSRLQVVRHVVLPSALTWIIASLHVAFGFAIIGAIVGEYLGAQHGLGLIISSAQNNFDPAGVFGAMFIVAVIALVAEAIISRLEHHLLGWRPSAVSEPVQAL